MLQLFFVIRWQFPFSIDYEDQWMTLGVSSTGNVLVVHHTFNEIDASNTNIRIFSSRKAMNREKQDYMEEKQ